MVNLFPKGSRAGLPLDPFHDVLFVDIETASIADLKKVGAWVYSQHPSTHAYCVVFGNSANDDEFEWTPGLELPTYVVEFIHAGGVVVAHNCGFEIAIWTNVLRDGVFPEIAAAQWRDTQAMGLALNLPHKLEGLARALGAAVQKDLEGAKLMRKMASAVELGSDGLYHYPMETVINVDKLVAYCAIDVRAMKASYVKLIKYNAPVQEDSLWVADQEINARGVYLDRNFAKGCQRIALARKAQIDDEVFDLTGGDLCSASAVPAMKTWVRSHGVKLPKLARSGGAASETMNMAAVQTLVDADPPPLVRAVLERRLEASSVTSLAKLDRVDSMTGIDGRLHNGFQFQGAHTGRWASYGLQLHNLPKVKLSAVELALARSIVEVGDLDLLTIMFDRPLEVLKQLLRSIVSAPPGYELIAADFAAIEARVLAWLAGQLDVLELFRAGEDVYVHAAAAIGSDDRQLGKVCTLALGFGMGPLKFHGTAANQGVNLELSEAKRISTSWREANDRIVEFWFALEDAIRCAVKHPGTTHTAGKIKAHSTGSCLQLQLPSGRVLRYWRPALIFTTKTVKTVTDEGDIVEMEFTGLELRFFTTGRDKSSMVATSSYGGKFVENVTQAVARDLLGAAITRLRAQGWPYQAIGHWHDSLAAEVPKGRGDVEEFCWLMEQSPAWADGLPIKAEGYRDTRFRG